MRQPVPRSAVEAFYQAYISRDPARIAEVVDDDVEWHVAGPVDVMQVCGHWHGKAAVVDWFARRAPQVVEFKEMATECLLVDGDASAMFGRITCKHRQSGRMISHRVAHFARYRNGKLFFIRILNDGLDAVEQFIGRRIDLTADAVPFGDELAAVGAGPALTPI